MSKLTEFLKEYAKNQFADTENSELKSKALVKELERTFKDEILEEEAKTLSYKIKRNQVIAEIERIKDLFWTVVVIGITVGITANQITSIICLEQYETFVRIIVIAALITIMYVFFHLQYLREANKKIKEFEENEDD